MSQSDLKQHGTKEDRDKCALDMQSGRSQRINSKGHSSTQVTKRDLSYAQRKRPDRGPEEHERFGTLT